jgi:hypothetical protein
MVKAERVVLHGANRNPMIYDVGRAGLFNSPVVKEIFCDDDLAIVKIVFEGGTERRYVALPYEYDVAAGDSAGVF